MQSTPALNQLAGAYFHQDWMLDAADEWVVFDEFLTHEPTLAPLLLDEIDSVLQTLGTDDEVRDLMRSLGSCYTTTPDEGGYRGWLEDMAQRIRDARASATT